MKDTARRSPPSRCDLTRGTLTIKGHGDLSSTENQMRFAAALLRLPQPTDTALKSVQQSFQNASD